MHRRSADIVGRAVTARDSDLPLFGGRPMARRSDHDSSHAAADRLEASGAAASQRAKALELVRRFPGMSSLQLARLGKVDRVMLARRLPELRRDGLVECVRAAGREIQWFPRRATT